MKLLSFLIFIYISHLFISYPLAANDTPYNPSEAPSNDTTNAPSNDTTGAPTNDTTDAPSDESIDQFEICIKIYNENMCKALFFMAPSYFALVIKEILNNYTTLETKLMTNSSCLQKYFTEKNDTKIKNLVKYSSKSFPDFGDEEGCLAQNTSNEGNAFLLFTIDYYYNQPTSDAYKGKFKLLPFISKGYSFFGLCVENVVECTTGLNETIMNVFNNESINGLNEATIKSFLINRTEFSRADIEDRNSISIYFLIFIIYIVFRIAVWIFGYYFFKEKNEDASKKKDDDSSSSEEEEEEDEEDQSNSQTNSQSNSQSNTNELKGDKTIELIEKKEKIIEVPKKEIYPKLFYFYKICSFSKSFKNLVIIEGNELFNEKDLYLIIFFRFLALLLKVFHFNFDFFMHNPSKEINNTDILQNIIMSLVNISSFSDVVIIITESIIVSYKLMSFLRKYANKDEGPSFPLFLNFFIRIIPSMLTVILSFVLFYVKYNIIIAPFHFMGINIFSTKIQHLKENILKCYSCINNAKNFIPFYMHYNDNFDFATNTNKSCFQFMIIFVNMFYCYCFCLLITYIAFKVKNKIFDIIISILFLINYVLPNGIYCKSPEYFNLNIILGEICSTTKTHLFINYYLLGFLIGFALFYNNDITTDNSLQNTNMYKPFYFLKDAIGFFFKLSNWVHILIVVIVLIIFVLLSIYTFFYNKYFSSESINREIDGFTRFIYLNDKSAFGISFTFFLIVLYTYKTAANIKEFGNNIFIIFFHRIGYDFYCCIEIMVYIVYSTIGLNYSLTGQNLAFTSIGIIFYIIISATVNNILLYIPIKHCLNKIAHCRSS